jgi:small-conductance mechanosensitive channel
MALSLAAVFLPSLTAQLKPPAVPSPQASRSAATPASTLPPPAPDPIPLTQIALRSEELSRTLREISRRLPPDGELSSFEEQFREQEESVRSRLKQSSNTLAGGATIMELREEIRQWRAYSTPEERQRKTLSAWGTACEQGLAQLDREQAIWEATLKATAHQAEFKSVSGRIRPALADIRTARREASERLRKVLDLQARISKQAVAIAGIMDKLSAARQRYRALLFRPDVAPIWRTPREEPTESIAAAARGSLANSYSSLVDFVRTSPGLISAGILFVAGVFVFRRKITRTVARTSSSDEAITQAVRLLGRSISLTMLIVCAVVLASYPLSRLNVVVLLAQLSLFSITRLLPLYAGATRLIYLIAGFFTCNVLIAFLDLDPVTKRRLVAALFAGATFVLAWWGRPVRLRKAGARDDGWENRLIRLSLAVLAVILITNIVGLLQLSNLLRLIILSSSCFGLLLYTLVRVTTTLFAALLRAPRMRSLAAVRMHEGGLVKWTGRALRLAALFCWLSATLGLLGWKREAFQFVVAVLNARPGIRAFNFSLGDILGFVAVLTLGYLIARAIRFILRHEILSHARLSRGVPEAISTTFYYLALLVVFLMSLNAGGIQLDRLTVLTGAVGVGIGFGLQNLVNNFVSGLILQYERPIRTGDVLEVGNLSGEIRHIGIRSSTMRTFQGAEVIIPNSAFISDKVINWTLTEARRRVDLAVRVAYGTDPELVIEILANVANQHPEVLREPEPCAVFQGFGESALDFLLMFWATQTTHFRIRSEIAIRVNAVLREAGIEIAVPRQDVRVQYVEAAALQRSARY